MPAGFSPAPLDDPPIDVALLGRLCDATLSWPLPGSGRTLERFDHLVALARRDVVLGRLVEAHADAVAITAELGGDPVAPGERWGVWAAGPAESVTAAPAGRGWRLSGTKQWCSGATLVDHALVDASTPDGQLLFSVRLSDPGVHVGHRVWAGPGMRRADTRSVCFEQARGVAVGAPDAYLTRPGFWAGAVAVASCWHGGTVAVAQPLLDRCRSDPEVLLAVHLGAIHVSLSQNLWALRAAAATIDEFPGGDHQACALGVRSTIERNSGEVVDRVGRALGPGPLAHDRHHAVTVADLAVYVRQHHAERDLAEIGRRVAAEADPWAT